MTGASDLDPALDVANRHKSFIDLLQYIAGRGSKHHAHICVLLGGGFKEEQPFTVCIPGIIEYICSSTCMDAEAKCQGKIQKEKRKDIAARTYS